MGIVVAVQCLVLGFSLALSNRTQPRLLPKVRGQLIESVAWNKVEQSDTGTGPILLGTSNGQSAQARQAGTSSARGQ